ncbi:MAG: hypothetical protein LQ342_004792 [Letrouitia transgressa]|nr:MAG: hypothetical protein LQ342_004792 [Letrouitia transgressa]
MPDYQPPAGGTDVGSHPRSLSDFPKQLAACYFFSTVAYANLLSLTSVSPKYWLEALQVLAFAFFPMLSMVQLCSNSIKAMAYVISKRFCGLDAKHVTAGAIGMRTNIVTTAADQSQSYHILDLEPAELVRHSKLAFSFQLMGRMALAIGNVIVSGLSIAAYKKRLNATYHGATFVAALGFDHRMAWLAIGALVAALSSIPILCINAHWDTRSREASVSSNRLFELYWTISIAALIQDVLQQLTNHPSSFQILGQYLFFRVELVVFWLLIPPIALYHYRRRIPISMVVSVGMLWAVSVSIIQLIYDIQEVVDLENEEYRPWNYRWALKDTPWWSI